MSDELKKLLQEQLDTPNHPNPQLWLWNLLRDRKIKEMGDAIRRQQAVDNSP